MSRHISSPRAVVLQLALLALLATVSRSSSDQEDNPSSEETWCQMRILPRFFRDACRQRGRPNRPISDPPRYGKRFANLVSLKSWSPFTAASDKHHHAKHLPKTAKSEVSKKFGSRSDGFRIVPVSIPSPMSRLSYQLPRLPRRSRRRTSDGESNSKSRSHQFAQRVLRSESQSPTTKEDAFTIAAIRETIARIMAFDTRARHVNIS